MVKDIRNNANRVTNCESANIDKTVAAAAVHLDAVRKIEAHGGLALLPEELREVARLRLENPDMSLRELGETHGSAAEPIRHQPPAAPHCGTRGQAALTERNVMDYVRLRPSPCSQ